MPSIRLPTAAAAVRSLRSTTTQTVARRTFTTTRANAGGHGTQYDPPTGWLFGVKPGEKYQKEGWENLMFYGFFGSLGIFAVVYAFKPDTS
jgi:hypothetical protein